MDHYFMEKALEEAKRAYEENEIPIGAVIVYRTRLSEEAIIKWNRIRIL